MTTSMPAGTYFALVGNVRSGRGGLTSALLERTRLINARLALGSPARHMAILTLGKACNDDPGAYGLVDGKDVLNIERHSGHRSSAAGWNTWLTELTSPATAETPVYIICDGHHVGAAVSQALADTPHVYFIQVLHNPTNGKAYAKFRGNAHRPDALVCATGRQAAKLRTDPRHGGPLRNQAVFDIPFPRRDLADGPGLPGAQRDPRRIMMLARVENQKDIPLAIEAFAELRRAANGVLPDWRNLTLDVYGAINENVGAHPMIDDLDLRGAVRLHDHRPGATAELAGASILWLTSRFEGWGLAITEAQQLGCIPIAVDVPFGPREQIDHGHDGYLVSAGADRDSTAWCAAGRRARLARRIAKLTLRVMRDDIRAQAARQNAITKVNARSRSPEVYIDNWVSVLETVTSSGR